MNFDSESPDNFVPPPGAVLPRPPRPPPKDVDYITPGVPFMPLPRFPFWDSLHSKLARLSVNNASANQQAFFIYPSPPKATGAFPKVEDVRISVYQSSKLVKQASGSITFALPFLPTLNWANSKTAPGIIAIAGTEPISNDPSGMGEYTVTPGQTIWMLMMPTMEGDDPNFGVLSIPEGSEPVFLSNSEIKDKNISMPKDVKAGTIAIRTDGLTGLTSDVRPFIGIGAVDPKFPYTVIPIMTWIVQPNRLYQITPNLCTWRVAAGDPTTPGAIIDTKLLTNACDVTFNPAPGIPTNVYFQSDSSFAM